MRVVRSRTRLLAALAVFFGFPASARIQTLRVNHDTRFAFSIESFGFYPGGNLTLTVHDIESTASILGFVAYAPAEPRESAIAQTIEHYTSTRTCALDRPNSFVINISDPIRWVQPITVQYGLSGHTSGAAFYDVMFTQCQPEYGAYTSFTLDIVFMNAGPNYLTAGEMPLPLVYGVMAIAFVIAAAIWLWYCRKHREDAHYIHHLMSALVVIKAISGGTESLMYYYISVTGHTTGWNVVYYMATFVRGLLLIGVIALIGTGWSLYKPYLSGREKKLMMYALAVQIINNVAIIIIDEMTPGSTSYVAWTEIFHIADIIVSVIVLVPVYWQIQFLRQAQASDQADEKTSDTLARLSQFRSFYITALAFLYFTRLIVYLLWEVLPFYHEWLSQLFQELATLAFYAVTAYRFRPARDNEYLIVPTENDAETAPQSANADGRPEDSAVDVEIGTSSATMGGAHPTTATQSIAPLSRGNAVTDAGNSQTVSADKEIELTSSKQTQQQSTAPPVKRERIVVADDAEMDADDEFGLDEDDFDIGLGNGNRQEDEMRPLTPNTSSTMKKANIHKYAR